MKLGKYFTLAELTQSATAKAKGIDNTPSPAEIARLRDLVENTLDPLREALGKPIIVSNGFRNPTVNRLVGGVPTSQHQSGEAVDFTVPGMTPAAVIRVLIRMGIPFDQVIDEYGSWVHLSYRKERLRYEALEYRKVQGRTVKKKFI